MGGLFSNIGLRKTGSLLASGFGLMAGKGLGAVLNVLFNAYKTRVLAALGLVESDTDATAIFQILSDNSLYDEMKLLATPQGGLKVRVSGTEEFITTEYDFTTANNDVVQTTEISQPPVGGRIAPNEKQCAKNVTGASKSFTHPDVVVTGTYTIIKVLNDENSGKTVVSFTEVGASTLNSIAWTGKLYLYAIYGGTIAGAVRTSVETSLLAIFPEMESVTIGSQEWATSNLDIVATAGGTVIANVTEAANVEKAENGSFTDPVTEWTSESGWSIGGGLATGTTTSNAIFQDILTTGKWYKLTYEIVSITGGSIKIECGGTDGTSRNSVNTYTEYLIGGAFGNLVLRGSSFTGSIDNVSVEEVGWAGSQDLYDGLIAQGESVQTALEAAAMWCYYNNDSEVGAVYGKLYNWFAAALIQADIDTFNLTGDWGYHIPTEAEFIALQTALGGSAVAGGKMKVAGEVYWISPNTGADNESGFSALPNGRRGAAGTFQYITTSCRIWQITEQDATYGKTWSLSRNDAIFSINAGIPKYYGNTIRLLKD